MIIKLDTPVPDLVDPACRMYDPDGGKVLDFAVPRRKIDVATEKSAEFSLRIKLGRFRKTPGIYTLLYVMNDSLGNRDILCQMLCNAESMVSSPNRLLSPSSST